jgi:ABC-2 type transport system permease protein
MRHLIQDTWALTVRMLKHNIRSMDTIMTVLAMPLLILLAFVYVLGGAINTGVIPYVDFVVPVVLLMCIASGVSYTAFRVNNDVIGGVFARLRAMPVARPALVGGHVVASVIVNAVSVALLLGVAFAIGYRSSTGLAGWGVTVGVLVLTLVAFSLMGVTFGLAAKTTEGSGMFSYIVIGLLFVSSGFAPTSTMPGPLRAFADHQPMTAIIDAIRGTQLGLPSGGAVVSALVWLVGLVAAFSALAALANRRATLRAV